MHGFIITTLKSLNKIYNFQHLFCGEPMCLASECEELSHEAPPLGRSASGTWPGPINQHARGCLQFIYNLSLFVPCIVSQTRDKHWLWYCLNSWNWWKFELMCFVGDKSQSSSVEPPQQDQAPAARLAYFMPNPDIDNNINITQYVLVKSPNVLAKFWKKSQIQYFCVIIPQKGAQIP